MAYIRLVHPHRDAGLRHASLRLPDRELAEVEDRGSEHGAGVALLDALDEMIERADAARGDDGNRDRACQFEVEALAPFRAPRILLVVIGRRSASAPASPSRGPGNGILRARRVLLVVLGRRSAPASASPSCGPGNGVLRAETGGRFQAQNAGERPEFGSQTATRLTNRPELRGFLLTRKPRRFARTAW